MADEQSEIEVEFISPADDAQIRLTCFEAAKTGARDFVSNMEQAKALYAWVMGFDELDETGEVGLAAGEATCTRKH